MSVAAVAAVLAVICFAVIAPRLARRLPPALGTRILAPASVLMAGCTVFVLGVLSFTLVSQIPLVARLGSWSTSRLDAADPVPTSLAVVSLVLLGVIVGWASWKTVRRIRALIVVWRTYHGAEPVVVLDSARPDAFATPAPAGRVVVTSGLWEALSASERQVVLAHERSHLTHGHTWWTLAADLSAAINPLLRPTARCVRHAVERWADEDATRAVADRHLVARTLARVALLKHDSPQATALTPAATGGDVPDRVRALLDPPPRRRPFALLALAALLAAAALGTLAVERSSDNFFDQATVLPAGAHGMHHHDG